MPFFEILHVKYFDCNRLMNFLSHFTPMIDQNLGPMLPDGCNYVFADGSRDARDKKELSIQQKFFDLQNWPEGDKKFIIKLNITKSVWNGRKWSYSYGTAYMNMYINRYSKIVNST